MVPPCTHHPIGKAKLASRSKTGNYSCVGACPGPCPPLLVCDQQYLRKYTWLPGHVTAHQGPIATAGPVFVTLKACHANLVGSIIWCPLLLKSPRSACLLAS